MPRYHSPEDEAYLAERVRQALHYNPSTGAMRWRITRQGGFAVRGAPAGSVSTKGDVRICIDGQNMTAARAAHLYQLGKLPEHRIVFRDGNRQNLAWENIRYAAGDLSNTKIAAYHRELRSVNQEIEQRLRESDRTTQTIIQAGGKDARAIRASIRQDIRKERFEATLTARHLSPDAEPEHTSNRFGSDNTWITRARGPRNKA